MSTHQSPLLRRHLHLAAAGPPDLMNSSAPSFKGTSHVLGSGPPPSAPASSSRPSNPNPNPRPAPKQQPPRPAGPSDFTPFTPLVSSSCRPDANGGDTVACPNCGDAFSSEHAVSEHIDDCFAAAGGARSRAAAYFAGNPPAASVEVAKKLLGNLLKEPGNDKYRRVRLGNPRIKEAVADREGGLDLLEAVGFTIGDESGELFAVMDETPNDAKLGGIRQAVLLLERSHPSAPLQTPVEAASKESCRSGLDEQKEVKKIVDRQIRVFFNVPGSSVAETSSSVPDAHVEKTPVQANEQLPKLSDRLRALSISLKNHRIATQKILEMRCMDVPEPKSLLTGNKHGEGC